MRQTAGVELLGVIEVSFDPAIHIGDVMVRWQTIGITMALLIGLGLASLLDDELARLLGAREAMRIDDMVYIVLGIVPGAVVGGRLIHGLAFFDAYAADPIKLLDLSVGTLSLTGALLGGTLSGIYVARLIGAPVRRWADVAVVPLLLTLGLGKFAQLLGGSGQGAAWDGPWAVAFVGAGPWTSPAPAVPAHPSQIYEGIWLLLGIVVVLGWVVTGKPWRGRIRQRLRAERGSGRFFVAMLVWFLLGRFVVGFTWRDDQVLGPVNVEQTVALTMLAAGFAGGLLVRGRSIVKR